MDPTRSASLDVVGEPFVLVGDAHQFLAYHCIGGLGSRGSNDVCRARYRSAVRGGVKASMLSMPGICVEMSYEWLTRAKPGAEPVRRCQATDLRPFRAVIGEPAL